MKVETIAAEVRKCLSKHKLPIHNEKALQNAIGALILTLPHNAKREYYLSEADIPDFFIEGLAVEVKIKGSARSIYKQCERYMEHDEVKALLLISSKSMGLPGEINGKPTYFHSISQAWL